MANPLTNRKFIHFNRLENFENQLQNNPSSILDTQIVFIKDARKIWTHGTYYTLDERITNDIYSKLEALAEISTDIIQKLDEAQFISAGPTADRPTGGELQQGICYLDTTLNEPIWWGGTNWIDAAGNNADLPHSGTTAQRPNIANVKIGFDYLDTTTGKFFISDGTQWVHIANSVISDITYSNSKISKTNNNGNTTDVVTVSLLKTDMALNNVGNFKAVSTEVNQNLTDTEKSNARTNIGAIGELPEATQTTPGIVQPLHSGNTNRSGLLITDNQGSLQVNTSSDLGLSINDMGLLQANIKGAATDAEIEAGTSTTKALTPSNMDKLEEIMTNSFISDPTAGHEYVEIGGIKWATMNIGASSETDDGLYFQWGDTQGYTKDEVGSSEGLKYFGWEDYKYGNGTSSPGTAGMTKYNETDSLRTLELSDDAAKLNWGSQWRMPTLSEFNTLLNSTTNEWVTDYQGSGVSGRLFTDNTDSSKTLFFPASGANKNGNHESHNAWGYYWSDLCYNGEVIQSHYLIFQSGDYCRTNSTLRHRGFSVRGVLDTSVPPLHKVSMTGDYNDLINKPDFVNNGSYNSTTKEIELKHDNTILATIDATAFIKDGMVDGVAILNDNLVITFNTESGKQPISIPLAQIFNPSNYYTKSDIDTQLVAKADLVNGTVPTNELPMEEIKSEVKDSIMPDPAEGHDYVEIGGVKWATMNVGASSITDYGLYFAWGDTEGYTSEQVGSGEGLKNFGWADYKWSDNGSSSKFTKYNDTDGKTALDLEDDAVAANWGGDWRLPTAEEINTFSTAVNTEWVTNYNDSGVNGLLCTDKTDSTKVLFFPAAGYTRTGSMYDVSNAGSIWSNSLVANSSSINNAWSLYLHDYLHGGGIRMDTTSRCGGHSVRGVLDVDEMPSKLHKVAVTGDYNDLDNQPIIPDALVNSDWNAISGVSQILNKPEIPELPDIQPSDLANGYEYVDLGLPSGTLWAKANIGAESETDAGKYFQWGDTQGYTTGQIGSGTGKKYFDLGDYKYYDSSTSKYTKYNETDNKTVLDIEDDAARANMGGAWQVPTTTLFNELINNTTYEWTTVNGVLGSKFTASNGNYIFIPISGLAYAGSVETEMMANPLTWCANIWGSPSNTYKYKYNFIGLESEGSLLNSFAYWGISIRGVINGSVTVNSLHKVAVTGNYNDLVNKPQININSLYDILSYGVEWTKNATSPILTRIGNLSLHKSLPIQSQYKGCVYDVANKEVKYWLDPNDWSKKVDGTAAVLDGTDGQVMVHTPKFYGKSGETQGNYWVRISTTNIDGTWTEIPEMFVAAYRGTVNNTDNKAASVVNTNADYRGGNNRSAYDEYLATDPCKSDLGKPRTNASRAIFRTWARNLGAELLSYEQYKWVFYWAYVIEYANFNCQAAYNENLTADGLHQGGLGDGVTTWDYNNWNSYNGIFPLTPCGYNNELGNGTGIKSMTAGTKEFSVPRWRGFDNPFGDIWTNLDGIIIQGDTEGNPKSVYTTTNPAKYGDSETQKAQMTIVGHEIHQDGYTLEFDLSENAEIIPIAMGGNVTTGKCDYNHTGTKDASLRTLLVGGTALSGGSAGLGLFASDYGVGTARTAIGFRFVVTVD